MRHKARFSGQKTLAPVARLGELLRTQSPRRGRVRTELSPSPKRVMSITKLSFNEQRIVTVNTVPAADPQIASNYSFNLGSVLRYPGAACAVSGLRNTTGAGLPGQMYGTRLAPFTSSPFAAQKQGQESGIRHDAGRRGRHMPAHLSELAGCIRSRTPLHPSFLASSRWEPSCSALADFLGSLGALEMRPPASLGNRTANVAPRPSLCPR